jgi:hypothetical protein
MTDAPNTADPQLLHLVIGGELRHLDAPVFRDLSKVEFVGAFPNYAHMRFFILHAHRMIDPRGDA